MRPMPLAPKLEDFPKIRGALRFYQVFAYITGIMLLLLCVEMIVKYGLGYQLFAFSNYGVLTFVPVTTAVAPTGVDLSTGILIAHGWLYVVYLFSDFRLWSLMRWPSRSSSRSRSAASSRSCRSSSKHASPSR